MIYDVHSHIGVDLGFYLRGWWPYAATAQDLLQHMDAHGIDRAVAFPFALPSAFDPYSFADHGRVRLRRGRVPFDRENLALRSELCRIDADRRILMLAMFDPSRKPDRQVAALEKLFASEEARGRVVGLKVQATILESPIAALLKEGRVIMQFAEARRLPVLIHTSIIASDRWSPASACLDVAEAYPKARFNLAHSLRFHRPSIERAAKIANVWVDCGAHLGHCQLARENHPAVARKSERLDANYAAPTQLLEAMAAALPGRFMWGSDNPYMSWCDDTIRAVYSYRQEAAALHALPAAVKRRIATAAPEAWLWGRG